MWSTTYVQMTYMQVIYICLFVSQEQKKRKETKMKDILGWKYLSFAYSFMIILFLYFILKVSYDMSRNVFEYLLFKRMLYDLLMIVVGIKILLQTTKKCWNLRRVDALNSIQKTMLKFDPLMHLKVQKDMKCAKL